MTRLRGWEVLWGDASLSALLAAQVVIAGQLFPATFVARLAALHLAHGEGKRRDESGVSPREPQD